MIVDFPEPEGPTRAVVLPASNIQEKFFKTSMSGRVGYLKPVGGYGGADVVRTDTGEKMFGEDALQEGLQPGEESNQDVQLADKDAFLMREHFDMRADFNDMSPGEQAGVTGRADVDRLAC